MSKSCGVPFTASLLHPKYFPSWLGLGIAYLFSWLPLRGRHVLGKGLGSLIYRHNKKRMVIVTTNLRIAFPSLTDQEIQDKALSSMQWYGRAMLEYCFLFFASSKRLQRLIFLEGEGSLDNAIAQKKNIVILLMHSVWLDFAPAGLGAKYTLYGSYKSVKNPVINWMMAKSRCKHVEFVVSREQGMMKLVRSLRAGRLLVFLPDEDLGEKHSEFAPFFGENKATLNTPARIAKLKKAACFPCYVYFNVNRNMYSVKIGEEVDLLTTDETKSAGVVLNQHMENMILTEPDQYMWLLKYYKTRPKGEASFYPMD